jgi:probable F420-dependent oxidoreductase
MSAAPHPRRFRFGVELQGPFEGRSWADSAREVEALGYSTLFVPDHFHQGLGPMVAMATAAMATTSLIVAPMVLAADFRNPAVEARELATIDLLSGGRLEVGLGAGYNPLDYSRSGIPMDPPGVRVSRLIEHTRVLRGLFAGGEFGFEGQHHRIEALTLVPAPATPGGPSILIGGGGPRLLQFAAREADIVGVNPSTAAGRNDPRTAQDCLPAAFDAKLEIVRRAAGDRFDALELNGWLSTVVMTPDARSAAERLAPHFATTVDELLDAPVLLFGTVDEMVERLQARRERWGLSYFVVQAPVAREFAAVVARLAGA